ncbi:uncharacterized protein VNE69_06079 [Vairimorpha necatrix]|uniref:Uncharacterized protein n=1 Tax=Vairimorpha necatrix TaxID=6039 RepID=A0AAX4JD18_9MICR
MKIDTEKKKLFVEAGLTCLGTVVLYLIFKIIRSCCRKNTIEINIDSICKKDITSHINKMKKHNPDIDKETLRLLYISFYSILLNYKTFESGVVVYKTKRNSEDQTPLEFTLLDLKPAKSETPFLIDQEKITENDWFKKLLLFSVEKVDGNVLFHLSERDKFLILNNRYLIEACIFDSQIQYEENLIGKLLEKSIQTTDEELKFISPAELMFSKHVQTFILK